MILVESRDSQWWITGFDPKTLGNADFKKQVVIGCVDFSGFEEMYNALKLTSFTNDDHYNYRADKYCIFDDDTETVWIEWYMETGYEKSIGKSNRIHAESLEGSKGISSRRSLKRTRTNL